MKFTTVFVKTSQLVFLIIAVTLVSACGKNPSQQIVKDVSLQSFVKDGDIWVDVSAMFKLGNASLTSITLPIFNPNNSSVQYGEIRFQPTLNPGYNEIGVSINLSDTARIQGGGNPTLPNGANLPIGGINNAQSMVELEIAQINSKIYFALDRDVTMLGFAIAIKEFDVLSRTIGGANVFLGFEIAQVLGMVGLFTGSQPMQSGLGFFVDLSSVISTDALNDLLDGTSTAKGPALASSGVASKSFALMASKSYESVQKSVSASSNSRRKSKAKSMYKDTRQSRRYKYKVKKALDKVSKRNRRLRLH